MLVARLVGASGEVVGIERDAASVERAEARVAVADLRNVNFLNADVNNIVTDEPFDAAVGRFILMFLPDPISVLRSVAGLVRPGGALAFQEPSWTAMLALGAPLPLWSRSRHLIVRSFCALGQTPRWDSLCILSFKKSGCLHPKCIWRCRWEATPFIRLTSDLLCSLRP